MNAPRLGFGADVDAGELVLEASLLGRELKVEKAAVQVFGGALELEPSRLDFAERPIPLIVRIRDVDLAQALAALSQPGLSGGGTVSGVLPFRWMSDSIELEGGELTGAGPGVFRYRGPAADDSLAFRALRNFLYRQLQARLDYRPSGDYRLGVRLEGHNPDVLAGHPIAFKLNVSGRLPELLRQGILAGDFERPVLEMYQNAQTEPKPGRAGGPRKPPPADRRNR
ncbi:MAG: hypothetical protein FIA97_00145 [Methylococcaceae bacterium]|nr:hypothetical protein [Methylococcaceae bacterium]